MTPPTASSAPPVIPPVRSFRRRIPNSSAPRQWSRPPALWTIAAMRGSRNVFPNWIIPTVCGLAKTTSSAPVFALEASKSLSSSTCPNARSKSPNPGRGRHDFLHGAKNCFSYDSCRTIAVLHSEVDSCTGVALFEWQSAASPCSFADLLPCTPSVLAGFSQASGSEDSSLRHSSVAELFMYE